jgi:hypothetical protein
MLDIESRLTRLENQNRWLKGLLCVLAGAALIPIAMGAARTEKPTDIAADTVIAKTLIIEDINGKERAILTVENSGAASLSLFGAQPDRAGIKLTVANDRTDSFVVLQNTPGGAGLGLKKGDEPRGAFIMHADGNVDVHAAKE